MPEETARICQLIMVRTGHIQANTIATLQQAEGYKLLYSKSFDKIRKLSGKNPTTCDLYNLYAGHVIIIDMF